MIKVGTGSRAGKIEPKNLYLERSFARKYKKIQLICVKIPLRLFSKSVEIGVGKNESKLINRLIRE